MDSIVVDTNVWASAGKSIADANSADELDCIVSCANWLQEFLSSDARLLADLGYKVIDEYMSYIAPGQFTAANLIQLYTALWGKLEFREIEYDGDGHALLPDPLSFHDPADRKFIALAISETPFAPIYNATDTDWEQEKAQLHAFGITVHELCQGYIAARIGMA